MNLWVFSCLKASFSILFWNFRCFSSRRMFFSVDDDPNYASIARDGTSTYMSALPLEEELLIKWNDVARLSLLTNLLIFLQNKQSTQLVEWIRKIESQGLAIQESVVWGLIVWGSVFQGCLMDFSNQDFGRTLTLIFFIFPLNYDNTCTLNSSHSF